MLAASLTLNFSYRKLVTLYTMAAFASPDIDLSKPVDFKSLKGKTVVITGGASGFGKAMALLWASKGWVGRKPGCGSPTDGALTDTGRL